jgi:urease accessory protein
VDWLPSGRAACGERWAFESFHSRNEVFFDGKRVFLDSLRLDPAAGEIGGPHRMGRFNCLAMLLLLGVPFRQAGIELLKLVSTRPVAPRESLVRSATAVHDGVLLRLAGESVEAVGQELHGHLGFVREMLGDDPWERKW